MVAADGSRWRRVWGARGGMGRGLRASEQPDSPRGSSAAPLRFELVCGVGDRGA